MVRDGRQGGQPERSGGSATPSRKPTADDQVLGRSLRDARKQAGKNQEWLARELGITYQQLGKYERGESSLKVWMLVKAAGLLGVRPAVFVDAIGRPGLAEPERSYEAEALSPEKEFERAFERAASLWPRVRSR